MIDLVRSAPTRSWVFAAVLASGCGARDGLDTFAGADASPPDLAACSARDYTSNLLNPVIAVTTGFVYYTEGGSSELVRVPKHGSSAPQKVCVLEAGEESVEFVADDWFVWWVDASGFLTRVAGTGGGKVTMGCAVPTGCPAQGGSKMHVRALTAAGVLVSDGTELYLVPQDGGSPKPLTTHLNGDGPIGDVATDDAMALWLVFDHAESAKLDGTDMVPTHYASWPAAIALHGGYMYWTLGLIGQWRLQRQQEGYGGHPFDVAIGKMASPLAAGDAFVYGGLAGGGIGRVPVGGGPIDMVAPGVVASRIVVDGTCVYFVEGRALHRVSG